MKKRNPEKFADMVVEHFGREEADELDLSEFLDMAEECGLIQWEIYKPEKHGDDLDVEPGDKIWVPTEGDDDGGEDT